MLLEPGPIDPLDEAAIAAQLENPEPEPVPDAAIELFAALDREAGAADSAHDVIADEGGADFSGLSDDDLVNVVTESIQLDADAQQEPGDELAGELNAAEPNINAIVDDTEDETGPEPFVPHPIPPDYLPPNILPS